MTTPTPHGATELPEPSLFEALRLLPFEYRYFKSPGMAEKLKYEVEKVYYTADQMREYARAAIQQAAGAVPGWKLVPLEPTQAMLDHADKTVPAVFSIGDEYRAMLAASHSPLGREAGKEGSSDHLVPCAGDRVQVPLSDADLAKRAKIGAMLTDDNGKISMYPAEYRRILEGRYIRAFRDAEAAHGITAPAPRHDAPTSQINPGSAPREDGHG